MVAADIQVDSKSMMMDLTEVPELLIIPETSPDKSAKEGLI
jgi:hypothetical protein